MTAFDLAAYALASAGAIDAWLRGSVFATWRARAQARGGWVSELSQCPFCLAYQVPLWLCIYFAAPACFLPPRWAAFWQTPVYALAVARLVTLIDWSLWRLAQGTPRGPQPDQHTS